MTIREMVANAAQHDTLVCREMCRAAGVVFNPKKHDKTPRQQRHGVYSDVMECFSQKYGVRLDG